MDYSQVFAISAAGMAIERTRVDIAALNLANANTIQTADGVSYRPLRVLARTVFAAVSSPDEFGDRVATGLAGLDDSQQANIGFPQATIEPSGVEPRLVYEPGNPFADPKGFVTYPGVDTATEMVNMMSAMRSYEANDAAMNTGKALALKALDIGGPSS